MSDVFIHPAKRSRGEVVTTSLCLSQRSRRYVSDETLNDISMECRQDFSVLHLHDVWLEHRQEVSRGRNNEVSSVRLQNV